MRIPVHASRLVPCILLSALAVAATSCKTTATTPALEASAEEPKQESHANALTSENAAVTEGASPAGSPKKQSAKPTPAPAKKARVADTSPTPAPPPAPAKPPSFGPDDVSSMSWNQDGELMIGWGDGHFAEVDTKAKRGKVHQAGDKDQPVLAIAPAGDAAVVRGKPGSLVRVKDGQVLLEFQQLAQIEGVFFTPDGETLFVSAPDQLHVWKDATTLPKLLTKGVRLEDYVNRQNANFSAGFGEMRGPIVVDADAMLAFGRPSGQIVWWNMNNPTEAYQITRVSVPLVSIGLKGDVLLTTAKDGEFKAMSVKERQPLAYSTTLGRADRVATSRDVDEGFAMLDGNKLTLRKFDTGEVIWEQELPGDGEACGLAMGARVYKGKAQRKRVAACRGNKVWVYRTDGKFVTRVERSKGRVSFSKKP